MYLPSHFAETRVPVLHEAIRRTAVGTLVTLGTEGLEASHVPMLIDPDPAPFGTLRGHIARGNPQWKRYDGKMEALVTFLGPNLYVTPSWYETKRQTGKVVPTWNYATVHAHGRLTLVDDPAWLRAQIESLTQSQEGPRQASWQVADAPTDFLRAQIKGIVGIEIEITRLEGKWKVSQNRPLADRTGVASGLRAEKGPASAMADLVEAFGP